MEEEKWQGQARQGWDDGNHAWAMWKELRQSDSEHIYILSEIQREWVRRGLTYSKNAYENSWQCWPCSNRQFLEHSIFWWQRWWRVDQVQVNENKHANWSSCNDWRAIKTRKAWWLECHWVVNYRGAHNVSIGASTRLNLPCLASIGCLTLPCLAVPYLTLPCLARQYLTTCLAWLNPWYGVQPLHCNCLLVKLTSVTLMLSCFYILDGF